MDEQQALRYLRQLQTGGMTMGLERMRRIMALCGDPHRRLRAVHIAGTNGKGSTARMIQRVAMAAGYRVGMFSSPAVTGVRETIDLDGQAVGAADFARWITAVRDKQKDMGEAGVCSEFETLTAAAFGWLAEQNPDLCVIECGLGGAEDATNVLPPPLAAVITPVSLDHTAILGDTVEAITRQKCGIFKPPCAVITAPDQSPQALGVIWEEAAKRGLTVRQPQSSAAVIRQREWGLTRFSYGEGDVLLHLTGDEQVANALTAMETVAALADKGYAFTPKAVAEGLAAVAMPCRQEVIRRDPLRVIDGAHNPAGIGALAASLGRFAPGGVTLLLGMLADKDVDACLAILKPHIRRLIATAPDNPRALSAAELAEKAAAIGIDALPVDDPVAAWERAEEMAGQTPLLIGGSFYLGAVLRPLVKNRWDTPQKA
ncbi:MAG: bifunctional folylpolyglutamate synthase/dihydrofolate synthase [Acutalibacteraceae bacterium]|jgi:dihydrofolate synthase/folylpolyglutamate synthase